MRRTFLALLHKRLVGLIAAIVWSFFKSVIERRFQHMLGREWWCGGVKLFNGVSMGAKNVTTGHKVLCTQTVETHISR